MVEATGLEPTTSWSLTKRATKLRYTSLSNVLHYTTFLFVFQVKSIGNREIFKFFLRREKRRDPEAALPGGYRENEREETGASGAFGESVELRKL